MYKKVLACLSVVALLLSGTVVVFSGGTELDFADYDYVFYSYEEFREIFPLMADSYEENFFADESRLIPDSIMLDVMLPCGEIVQKEIQFNGVLTHNCYVYCEMQFDSYYEFRVAFPLADGDTVETRAIGCGGWYRIATSRIGCSNRRIGNMNCAVCGGWLVPLYECRGKRYEIRRDCTVCGVQRWEEVHGAGCGAHSVGRCLHGC